MGASHVEHGNSLGDRDDQRDPGVRGLENGIRCERRRHVHDRCVRSGLGHRLVHRVEDRNARSVRTFEGLSTLTGCDPRDDLRAVLHHLAGMERTVPASDALNYEAGVIVDENGDLIAFFDKTVKPLSKEITSLF